MNKLIALTILVIMTACNNPKQTTLNTSLATEPFVIYKTKTEYNNLVPVTLNNEKTTITSYPAPSDLFKNGELTLPTPLPNGYLIDNRGIGLNTAFTSFTYEEYSKLRQAPCIEELMNNIIDNDPIVELYDCREHLSIRNDIKKINKLVKNNIKTCKKLK